jgi:hypothetical protein
VNYVLFTRSNLLGSRIIRAVTGEEVSHCAILLSNTGVIHATPTGSAVVPLSEFKKVNTLVYLIAIPRDTAIRVDFARNKSYDWGAFCYLGLRLLLRKVGIRLPKKNLWQTTGMYLCTELVSKAVLDKETELTPLGLYNKLRSLPDVQ